MKGSPGQDPGRTWWDVIGGAFKFLWTLAFWGVVAIVVLGVIFDGSDEDKGSRPSKHTAASASTPAPDPTSQTLTVAQQAVTDYYGALDYYDYGRAWQLLGSAQRAEDQGFQTWRSAYDLNVET